MEGGGHGHGHGHCREIAKKINRGNRGNESSKLFRKLKFVFVYRGS